MINIRQKRLWLVVGLLAIAILIVILSGTPSWLLATWQVYKQNVSTDKKVDKGFTTTIKQWAYAQQLRLSPKFFVSSDLPGFKLQITRLDKLTELANELKIFEPNGVAARIVNEPGGDITTIKRVDIKLLSQSQYFDYTLTNGINDPNLLEERGLSMELSPVNNSLVIGIWFNPLLRERLLKDESARGSFTAAAVVRALFMTATSNKSKLISTVDKDIANWIQSNLETDGTTQLVTFEQK